MNAQREITDVIYPGKPRHFAKDHFKAITEDGRKFLYCPIGNICSWSEGDYDHNWCHWCKKFLTVSV